MKSDDTSDIVENLNVMGVPWTKWFMGKTNNPRKGKRRPPILT